ncbi:MAG: ABC transporter ATP-binding protein [Syntrophobacterales bacterium]|nr:ABC transporter ATP-binding protein [Syntrophobacterales bacterium]
MEKNRLIPSPYLTLESIVVERNRQIVIRGLSFTLKRQEIVSIIGPNGAGKSTIFDVITGFLKPLSGRVLFRGIDITGWDPYKICRLGIARTFQIARPFVSMTTLENVVVALMFGHKRIKLQSKDRIYERAREILEMVGLGHKSRTLARCLTLSEQRRLEVARAVATDPEMLLLDEFAAGLSPKAIESAITLIERLRREGLTLLIIDHFLNVTARISDRIIALDQGEIVASGSPEEVLQNPLVAASYLGDNLTLEE